MNALVTGATGFVGKYLVDELIKNNIKVIVLVRDLSKVPSNWENDDVSIIHCPLSEIKNKYLGESKSFQVDFFFHFAWEGTSGDNRANISLQLKNIEYTYDALLLAKKLGCKRFIYAGSIMEYEAIHLLDEKIINNSNNIYAVSKLMADITAKGLANDIGISYSNVVISNIYGAGEKSERFLNTLVRKMISHEMILLSECKQPYDFIYVTDAVRAIVTVGLLGRNNELYYIGNPAQTQLKEYVLKAKDVLGSESELIFGAVEMNGKSLGYDEFDTGKVNREFDFIPSVLFEEGIKKVAEWELGNYE